MSVGNEDAAPLPESVGHLWNAFTGVRQAQSGAQDGTSPRITRHERATAILVIVYRAAIVGGILAALECSI